MWPDAPQANLWLPASALLLQSAHTRPRPLPKSPQSQSPARVRDLRIPHHFLHLGTCEPETSLPGQDSRSLPHEHGCRWHAGRGHVTPGSEPTVTVTVTPACRESRRVTPMARWLAHTRGLHLGGNSELGARAAFSGSSKKPGRRCHLT